MLQGCMINQDIYTMILFEKNRSKHVQDYDLFGFINLQLYFIPPYLVFVKFPFRVHYVDPLDIPRRYT